MTCYPCIHTTFYLLIDFWMSFLFCFFVQRLLHTFMDLRLNFAATKWCLDVVGLTDNMFVNKHSDFLELGFLTGFYVIWMLVLLSLTPSGVDSIAVSIIYLRFCWSSHLPACWYIFLMLFIHLCWKEDLANEYWSIPIVFIWSSRRDNCNKHFIKTHCCSKVLIDTMKSMTFFNNLDLTHWAVWGYLLSTWKHKYSLRSEGNRVFFGYSTGKRGKVVINGVKQGGVDVAWTLILCLLGVTQEWM